jgi:hypothetical protein
VREVVGLLSFRILLLLVRRVTLVATIHQYLGMRFSEKNSLKKEAM